MAELKPCPFCGIPPKMRETNIGNMDMWVIYCRSTTCGVNPQTKYTRTRTAAIEAWNRRIEPAQELEFDYGAEVE